MRRRSARPREDVPVPVTAPLFVHASLTFSRRPEPCGKAWFACLALLVATAGAGCSRAPDGRSPKTAIDDHTSRTSLMSYNTGTQSVRFRGSGESALRCYERIADSTAPKGGGTEDGYEWFYCTAGPDGRPGLPRMLPAGRTEITIGSQTLNLHPVETVHSRIADGRTFVSMARRIDMPDVKVAVEGLDLIGRPGYRIGYRIEEGRLPEFDTDTVFVLSDPSTGKRIGMLITMVRPTGSPTTVDGSRRLARAFVGGASADGDPRDDDRASGSSASELRDVIERKRAEREAASATAEK